MTDFPRWLMLGALAAALSRGSPLIVYDAAAENPALVQTALKVPPGFGVSPHTLRVPPGFTVSVLAAGLNRPRFMSFDPTGALLVASMGNGAIYRYPAAGGSVTPRAKPPQPWLSGLDEPSSLAFHDGYLYIGETRRVTRVRYQPGGPGAIEAIVPHLPTGYHNTKTVVFGPDGHLYVAVGSGCNICEEPDERRAAVSRYNPDGSGYTRFAHGLRNAVGLAFQPETGHLWATVNERDMQGNEIPPDLLTELKFGADYGWPHCQPPRATPQDRGARCEGVTPASVGLQAHSAPLGLAFARGLRFSPPYGAGLFVAQHGSWNRQPPAAPKLLHVSFEGARATGARIFCTGWQNAAGDRWGRPVGVVVAPDGSLIVSDDYAGLLYRISARS